MTSEILEKPFTLWRGDLHPIDRFLFDRTNTICLVGQGIYLTDSQRVARSYQEKGIDFWESKKSELWKGPAADRLAAYEQAFLHFIEMQEKKWLDFPFQQRQLLEMYKAKWRKAYNEKIEDGTVQATYVKKTAVRKGMMLPTSTGEIVVTIHDPSKEIGHLSRFDFSADFETKMYPIDDRRKTLEFWEMLAEEEIVVIPPKKRLDYAIEMRKSNALFSEFTLRQQVSLRRHLKKQGFAGYEYRGGVMIGTHGPHRAFCVWDQDLVNEHRRTLTGQPWTQA